MDSIGFRQYQYFPASYGSEEMANDIIDVMDDSFNAEIGDVYITDHGHAFNVTTPNGRKFLIAVVEIGE